MCLGIRCLERIPNGTVRMVMGTPAISEKVGEKRLLWFGHDMRRKESNIEHQATELVVNGARARGRPKSRWMYGKNADLKDMSAQEVNAQKRVMSKCKI